MKMCKFFTIMLILIPIALNAQIQVRLHQPPPNQLMIEHLWWVDLDNTTQIAYTVYLRAEITEVQKGLIFKGSSNTFTLAPGKKRIQPRDIKDVRDIWYLPRYKQYIIRTGKVAEGNYTVCIYVIDAKTRQEIGEHCINVIVCIPGPSRLISPKHGVILKERHPIFIWTQPAPFPVGEQVTYKLRIVEVLEGQTEEKAMRTNKPWFEKTGVTKTSILYPSKERSFEIGKMYAWQVQAFDRNGFPLGKNQGLSEIWRFCPEVLIPIEPLPRVLCMGEFILRNIAYESGSTLESLSGTAESFFIQKTRPGHFGGPIFIYTDINFKLDFDNLKASQMINDTADVIGGEIVQSFSSPVEVLVEDYHTYIHDIHLWPDSAYANVGVRIPCLYEETGCSPAELGPFNEKTTPEIDFYKELGVADRGPFRLGETGILIVSKEEVEIDLSRTITPAKVGITFRRGETIEQPDMDTSNTGYLYGKYIFDDGLLTPFGFSATLELASAWTFTSLAPMGFRISIRSGFLEIDSCKVKRGRYTKAYITLPQGVNGVHTTHGAAIDVGYDTLFVDSLLNLFGQVKIQTEMRWGGFGVMCRTGNFRLVSEPRPFLEPVQDDTFKTFTSSQIDTLTGLTLRYRIHDRLILYSPDAITPINLTGEFIRGWLNLEMQGFSGKFLPNPKAMPVRQVLLGDTSRPDYRANEPFTAVFGHHKYFDKVDSLFKDTLMNIEFEFVGNSAFDSDIGGQFKIPYPCNMKPPFNDLEVTSTASFVGGNAAFSDTLTLDYWGVGLTSKRGVVSVKVGEIIYTNAEIHEPIHFSKGFNIIWGEMLADGGLGEFYFNHNAAHQKFDGFPITLDSAALSRYDSAITNGELVVRCGLHFHFFGEPDTIITIHDAKFDSLDIPYKGRIVAIDPELFGLFRHWGSGMVEFDFQEIEYDSIDQNGFKGAGFVALGEFFPTASPFSATIVIDSLASAVCMIETAAQQLAFPPFASVASVAQIWGCVYIEGDELHRVVVGGNLHSGLGVSLYAEAGVNVEVKVAVTPTISKFACHGLMYFGTFGANIEVNGRIFLSYDRAVGSLEGEITGAFDLGSIGVDLEADGQANWYFGPNTNYIQGRLAVDISGIGFGTGLAGGLFIGLNAPKEKVWVLTEGSSSHRKFGINMDNLPDVITGVYVYGDLDFSLGWGIIEGGIEIYAGVGAFVNYWGVDSIPDVPFPCIVGIVGIYIHGEILWGLVSASAWGELELYLGHPTGFEGTVGLRGCVLWVLCAEVDLTVGWNTNRGFYVQ